MTQTTNNQLLPKHTILIPQTALVLIHLHPLVIPVLVLAIPGLLLQLAHDLAHLTLAGKMMVDVHS